MRLFVPILLLLFFSNSHQISGPLFSSTVRTSRRRGSPRTQVLGDEYRGDHRQSPQYSRFPSVFGSSRRRLPRNEHRGDPRQSPNTQSNDEEDEEQSYGTHHSQHYSSAYGRKQHPKHYYTSLSDVMFCLVMALGWTVWLLSSFIKTDFSKYQHQSVLVRGHVLQVSVEVNDSMGTGIPTYKAIIDYMVPQTGEQHLGGGGGEYNSTPLAAATASTDDNSFIFDSTGDNYDNIQIRKQFETSQLLTEGFANVELLVLPHEPTVSILREDYEKEFALHQHNKGTISANHSTTNNNNTIFSNTDMMMDDYSDDLEWWRTTWFRRATIAGAASLVLASVAGGIQVVIRLQPSQRCWGWVLVIVGVPLLLPAAIGIHYGLQKIRKMFDLQGTFIVRGAERMERLASRPCTRTCEDLLDARACDEEDFNAVLAPTTPCATPRGTSGGNAGGCYFVRVHHKNSKGNNNSNMCSPSVAAGASSGLLPTPINELEMDRSKGSSVTTVSSVSMAERSQESKDGNPAWWWRTK